jgi:hypothetical protein
MSEKITSEPVSRRTILTALVAAVGLAVPTTVVLTVSEAEAQTIGMERRQNRRALRHDRRQDRRVARTVRRIDRRTGGTLAPQ